MKIVLTNGKVLKNVRVIDNTKSAIGLFIWAINQARDQVLTFDKVAVKCSQIAAIIEDEEDRTMLPNYDARAEQEVVITDDDLPF